MVVAAILAGGSGSRMGAAAPKQYLQLGNEPILVHSVRAFLQHPQVDRVCVVVPAAYTTETEELLSAHFKKDKPLCVIEGGANRSLSLLQAAVHFSAVCPSESVFLTHDAVRPFVTKRMIDDSIEACRRYGAVGTVVPAVDTILLSGDGAFIDRVPPRSSVFHAQTPQTFALGKLTHLLQTATEEQLACFTDGCSVFLAAGLPVYMVQGEAYNIKITYPDDLTRGEEILKKYF